MFGGWAWLLNGNLLIGARSDGMLVRVGKGNDDWALRLSDVAPMMMRGALSKDGCAPGRPPMATTPSGDA